MLTPGDILEANWIVLYSVYGQVFFVLGLVTWLSARRESRLELSQALPWLAAFGIAHGLNEWGYIFIPLQAQYLPTAMVNVLIVAHLMLLAVSFFFLFQFGVKLLPAGRRTRPVKFAPAGMLILWAGALALRLVLFEDTFNTLIVIGDGWSRYLLCMPGALLAFYGFLRQSRQVRMMGFEQIARYLMGASVAFLGYSVVGGLIVPPAPIFPANVLNYDVLNATVHIPAQIMRSLCGLAMAVFVTRSLEIFQVETDQLIEDMNRVRILSDDRERIGRELHDGIIQSIYAAGLNLEDARHHLPEHPEVAGQRIQTVMGMLNETITDVRRYIFDLQAAEQARELELVLESLVDNLRLNTLLNVELEVSGQRCWKLGPEQVANMIQIAREALSNIVQHASASHATVQLHYEGDHTRLTIMDDGVGIPPDVLSSTERNGHGIGNMQDRAALVGGTLTLDSAPGQGTVWQLTVACDCARE